MEVIGTGVGATGSVGTSTPVSSVSVGGTGVVSGVADGSGVMVSMGVAVPWAKPDRSSPPPKAIAPRTTADTRKRPLATGLKGCEPDHAPGNAVIGTVSGAHSGNQV